MYVHLNLIYLLSQSKVQFNYYVLRYLVVIDHTHVYTHVYYLSNNSQPLCYLIKKFIIITELRCEYKRKNEQRLDTATLCCGGRAEENNTVVTRQR